MTEIGQMFARMKAAPNRQVELSPGPDLRIGTSDWRATVNGTRKNSDTSVRILAYTDRSGECWLWTRRTDADGYARITVDLRPALCHRVSYELFVGPIPPGLEIDHLCRVRHCVNPEHLEPVTHAENMRRRQAYTAAKPVCVNGHIQSSANVRRFVRKDGTLKRSCRPCEAAASARYMAKKKGAKNT